MMRTRRALSLVVGLALVVAPAAHAGFMQDLDKAMRTYGDNIVKTGDNNIATMKTLLEKVKTGKFKEILPAIDAGMKTYGGDLQKTGDDAIADIKAIVKDLTDIKTYIPAPLLKLWEAFVAELAVLRARFLYRCEHPWADDPPAGGGGGGNENPPPPADPPAGGGDTPPPADPPPASPAPAPAGGSAASPAADTPPPTGDSGSLPGDAQASSIRASGTRGPVVDVAGMNGAFDDFVGVRKAAQKAYNWARTEKFSAEQRTAVMAKVNSMVEYAHQLESKLVAKLARNATATRAFVAYVGKLDPAVARGSFSSLLTQLSRSLNAAALSARATKAQRDLAAQVSQLKAKIAGH